MQKPCLDRTIWLDLGSKVLGAQRQTQKLADQRGACDNFALHVERSIALALDF